MRCAARVGAAKAETVCKKQLADYSECYYRFKQVSFLPHSCVRVSVWREQCTTGAFFFKIVQCF